MIQDGSTTIHNTSIFVTQRYMLWFSEAFYKNLKRFNKYLISIH